MNSVGHFDRPTPDVVKILMGSEVDGATASRIQKRLDASRCVNLNEATVIITSWENRYAAAGGVRAVTQEYAKYLSTAKQRVLVLTPLHLGLKTPPGDLRLVSVLYVDFDSARRRVEIFENEWAGVRWLYIHCPDFFLADGGRDRSNPYIYTDDDATSPRLVRDCLLFAAVAPKVLAALNLVKNVVVHLQDWETVAVALTIKAAILRGELTTAVSVLAMHNPYDKYLGPGGWNSLRPGTAEPTDTPPTFLGRLLPLLDAPPATVSREFAVDLVTDPLQTKCLADHLQAHFRRFPPVGVDNGPFETRAPSFSEVAREEARAGDAGRILREKQSQRDRMKKAMTDYRPGGRWGDIDFERLEDDVPVFMCVGRLDPGQKGFDVAARAIEKILGEGIDARFVLTPILGNAPQDFIDDLEHLGSTFRGRVAVYPFRMDFGYFEIQAGATFSIWPSMYEPFGGVSEFLLRGTPVIARATGGLRQQIADFDPASGQGNGILYPAGLADGGPMAGSTGDQWRLILDTKLPGERAEYPIYSDQVEQLAAAMRSATAMFRNPRQYGRLLCNLWESAQGYSWKRAADEYALLYETACRQDTPDSQAAAAAV